MRSSRLTSFRRPKSSDWRWVFDKKYTCCDEETRMKRSRRLHPRIRLRYKKQARLQHADLRNLHTSDAFPITISTSHKSTNQPNNSLPPTRPLESLNILPTNLNRLLPQRLRELGIPSRFLIRCAIDIPIRREVFRRDILFTDFGRGGCVKHVNRACRRRDLVTKNQRLSVDGAQDLGLSRE